MLQQLITTKFLNQQLLRDSLLVPRDINVANAGLLDNPVLAKEFSTQSGGQITPELITYARCLPQEVTLNKDPSEVLNK